MATKKEIDVLNPEEVLETTKSFEQWFEENWKQVAIWVGVIVAAVLLFFAFRAFMDARAAKTQAQLDAGLAKFNESIAAEENRETMLTEALGSFETAAKGAGGASEAAALYQGLVLIKLGRHEDAITVLQNSAERASSKLIARGSKSALVQAYLGNNQRDQARETLTELIEGEDAYAAQALITLAGMETRDGNLEAARDAYQTVVDRFPESSFATLAQRELTAGGNNLGVPGAPSLTFN